jgi:HEPN domain-containing protein
MPHERYPPDDPREWLNRARSNLVQARALQPEVYLEDLCFQAQQAAEKALKSLLLRRQGTFPYVHDLALLLDLLEKGGEEIPPRVRETARLNQYAVAARYPGVAEPVEPEEYEEALKVAEDAVLWVEEALSEKPAPSDQNKSGSETGEEAG